MTLTFDVILPTGCSPTTYTCRWSVGIQKVIDKSLVNADGDALYEFKMNITDPNKVLENWKKSDDSPCRWNRVTCDGDGRVIQVTLGGADLSGRLVPALGNLMKLQKLRK
ncbi:somatic embryogenesis receptor kinase 2 [Phtheirospermum japonicum]|uniref:Somatic embryogenesis receptor kinase 2 n=1 Tax=Phtheirospermum japonicum TaxID=374723 RepID=A0A830B3I7_9LAMI|nr:somatic embryogenesis receptor kinase 2 [Phtheirospermum japonicum]